jgi:sialidase-1
MRRLALIFATMLRCAVLVDGTVATAAESFEAVAAGPLSSFATPQGVWKAAAGHAEIHAGHAREGRQSLKILGGEERSVELTLAEPLATPGRLGFWSERWTSKPPFAFVIEAAPVDGPWKKIQDASAVTVGGFLTRVEAVVPRGTARVRFLATTQAGVMLDAFTLAEDRPMRFTGLTVHHPVMPVLVRRAANPVLGIRIETEGGLEPLHVDAITLSLEGTTSPEDIAELGIVAGSSDPAGPFAASLGRAPGPGPDGHVGIRGHLPLAAGDNWLWVTARLRDSAEIDGRVRVAVERVTIAGRDVTVQDQEGPPAVGQRIGVALRRRHEDGADTYRIPGVVRTNAGSLVAAYDVRYRGAGDLPADIDVGTSRSTDGGRTWEPMRVAIDMGRDPKFAHDGVGDPCIFTDRETGRIFVAALWSHGRRAWHGSGPGLDPDETGQLVLVTSDDDGKTWSRPRNITRDVKDPAWRLLLAGPGTGITLADGTLVFPAQFKDEDNVPHATLIWSQDHGTTWHIGTGVKSRTTESQLVQLGDGAIMINCRDDRGGARTVAVTRDLAATWALHATDRGSLPESVCMASLLRLDLPTLGPRLFFSNPATTSGRHSMTVKVSADEGLSWPVEWHTLYDVRRGYGYSCLARADENHVGVLYEGAGELYFLRLPLAELMAAETRVP